MTPKELQRVLRAGESERVEFKSRFRNDEDLAIPLIALANSGGGLLVVGVDDDGHPIGLSDSRLGITSVRASALAERLLPVPVRMEPVVYDGLTLLVLTVPAVPDHLLPVRTATGAVPRRQGSRTLLEDVLVPRAGVRPDREVRVFVAMSFRFEEEPALVDYYEAMRRAASTTDLPLTLHRMDLLEGDYEISTAVVDAIRNADVVIADFTLGSPNVYFESGIAKGADKYVIRVARKGTLLPFDLRTWRTHLFANATQLESLLVDPLRTAYAAVTGQEQG